MRILVTGASGFVGKRLANQLALKGHQVTAVATSEVGLNGMYKIVNPGLFGMDVGHLYYNEVIFHQAANNDTMSTNMEDMWKANVSEPVQMLYIAKHGACKKFIYASSTAVYGNIPAPHTEGSPLNPLNVYARTKAHFDDCAMNFAKDNPHMTIIGLRYCNVYGPGEQHKGKRMSMIGQMLYKLKGGGKIELFEDGLQRRDWCYITDVVDANLLAMQSDKSDIYNIGSGSCITFNRIAMTLIQHLTPQDTPWTDYLSYIKNPSPETYQNHTECVIKKARTQLGYEPKYYDIIDGINEYVLNA